nr:hypothetical protein [Clostridia bacterium]
EATINKDLTTEYLNDLLVRVVNGMHTGHYEEPVSIKTNEEQNQNNQQEPQTDETDNGAEA